MQQPATDSLVARAQQGDSKAFELLVLRYQTRSRRVAARILGDEQEGNEVVQEAFLRAHERLALFRGTSGFYTWLYRIIVNQCLDVLRRRQRIAGFTAQAAASIEQVGRVGAASAALLDDPFESLCRRELQERLSASIEALPRYHRSAITLRELGGLSYEEIARAIGVSKGTVMSRLFHARQKLRRSLASTYHDAV